MEDSWAIKMAEEVIKGKIALKNEWCYENGVVLKALYRLYLKTDNKSYLSFISNYLDRFVNTDGTIKDLNLDKLSLADYNNAEICIDLYRETSDEKLNKLAKSFYEKTKDIPKTEYESFSMDDKIYTENFYFLQPFLAQAIKIYDNKLKLDEVIKQFLLGYKYLKDKKTGLLYQGYDEKRQSEWADKESGNSKCFWTKAIGTFLMALADSIEILTDKVYESLYLKEMAQQLATVILKYQDEESGCWYQIIDSKDRKGNYLEAGGSCMILYFLSVCLKRNVISGNKAEKAIFNAYNGIIDEFITITEKNSINLNKNSVMTALADKGDGSYAHYISLPIVTNDLVGVSAFILSMNEYEKIKYRIKK